MIGDMQRIQYVDRLKGLAMLTIVFGHCEVIGHLTDGPYYLTDFSKFAHLPLFMFMSGFMVSTIPDKKKIIVKLAQFLCPFLFVGYAFTIYLNCSFVDFFSDLWKHGYWYLFALTELYILLMPLRYNKKDNKYKQFASDIFYFFVIYIALYICRYHISEPLQNIIGIPHLYAYWFIFFAGFLCKRYGLANYMEHNNWVFSIALVYSIAIRLFSTINIIPKLPMFAMDLVLLYFFMKREKANTMVDNQLAFIGKNSIDVYIFHYFFVANLHLKLFGDIFAQNRNFFIEGILVFILTLIIAYLSILIGTILRKSEWINNIVFGNFAKKIINI